jgi:hypothetical protein
VTTKVDPNSVEFDVDEDDEHWHEAHMECQQGNPFVTTLCGRVGNWDEMRLTSDLPRCQECLGMDHCPICGALRIDQPPRT